MGENGKKEHKSENRASDVDDHISNRYDLKRRLGKGAYGIVWKAVDNQTKEIVAVKKIFDAFRNQTDAQRTFREIMFLQAFKDHPNIITLRGLHKAVNNKDIYLVFDFMDTDLHHVIKRGTVLKDVHKRYIMYQLFRATQYLHSGNVIHRDQKPSNVLINAECTIKIADFGLARSLTHVGEDVDDGILTDYVATRWYRAPEILVASKKYTKGVDMWSLGCILGELLLGKPLFPGSSTVNQMERIMAVLPEPTKKEIFSMCSGYGKGLLENYSGPKTTLDDLVHSSCEKAMSLLSQLLVFDPAKRLTATEALKHPYVGQHFSGRELILNRDVTPPLDDDIQLSVADYRNKLYEMIASARLKKKQYKQEQMMLEYQQSGENFHGKYTDKGNKSEYQQRINQMESKYAHGELKGHEGSLKRRTKYVPSEDVRDVKDTREKEKITGTKMMSTKPESTHKTCSNVKKVISSPSHRPNVPPPRVNGGWPDRQRLLCANQKTINVKPRYDDGGGDSTTAIRSSSSNQNQNQPPFRAALAQVKEKLKLANALNNQLSTLPKVCQKRELFAQNSTSSSHNSRQLSKHGILTASALQEIRSLLKH